MNESTSRKLAETIRAACDEEPSSPTKRRVSLTQRREYMHDPKEESTCTTHQYQTGRLAQQTRCWEHSIAACRTLPVSLRQSSRPPQRLETILAVHYAKRCVRSPCGSKGEIEGALTTLQSCWRRDSSPIRGSLDASSQGCDHWRPFRIPWESPE